MSLYSTAVLADSPFSYWSLDETSSTYADQGSGGNAGTVGGTVTRGVAGAKVNTSLGCTMAGAGNIAVSVLTGFGSALAAGFSVEFWYKGTSTAQGSILGVLNTGTTVALWVATNTDNTLANVAGKTELFLRDNVGGSVSAFISTNIYDGSWHHVVYTCTPSTGAVVAYVDGSSVAVTASGTAAGAFVNFGFALDLGARNNRGTLDNQLTGSLDEIALYKSILSSSRVTAHYNAASQVDVTLAASATRGFALAAPAGAVQTDRVLGPAVAGIALAAPAGSLSLDRVLGPAVAGVALAAPAGAVQTDRVLGPAVAGVALAAPAGSLVLDRVLGPAVAGIAVAAPAGSLVLDRVLGPAVAGVAVAAPAGSVQTDQTLATSPPDIALGAPPGSVTTTGGAVDVILSASAPGLILAAPAGSVTLTLAAQSGQNYWPGGISPGLTPQDFGDVLAPSRIEWRMPPAEFPREIDGIDHLL
jgi:hypothetical protein